MRNIAVLTHSADIDGVGCAALIKIKYNLPSNRLFFSGYAKDDILFAERKMRKLYGKDFVLFITDLSLNDPVIEVWRSIIKRIKAKGGKVFWFDHHPWSKKALDRVAKECEVAIVGENERYCATEITRMELGLDTPFINEFTRVVHFSDFNLKPRDARSRNLIKAYALSITSFTKARSKESIQKILRHYADVISGRRFTDDKILNESKRFEKLNNDRIKKMLKELYFVGKEITVGFTTGVQSTNGCGAIIQATGRDIGIIVDTVAGKGSMRTIKSDISQFAKNLGGGGHPHASGFEINTKKYPLKSKANREAFVKRIQEVSKPFKL
ncbi:MAG: hypothetical protein KGH71_00490 [Candidatus Micrarchaeota archaeon]|nr:hypothetical protein [Candidatus Micrarchaeota archaeon]